METRLTVDTKFTKAYFNPLFAVLNIRNKNALAEHIIMNSKTKAAQAQILATYNCPWLDIPFQGIDTTFVFPLNANPNRRQADLVAAQTERSIAPLLVAEVDEANPVAGHKSYRLFNRGQGIAFQVHYWEGHVNARFNSRTIRRVHPPTIGPGASAQVVIDGRLETWTARYKGIDDQERWLMVYLGDDRGQQHTIRLAGEERTLDL